MSQIDSYLRTSIKPRHLQLLVALDHFRSIGKVAENIYVTQPAVSRTLGEMEKGMGIKLFERNARGVTPTPYGECLIRHAKTLLANLTQARDELRSLASGSKGATTIGALPAVMPSLIPRSLSLLKQQSPETSVVVQEATLDVLLPELRAGKLDLIVGALPHSRESTDLQERILLDEPVCLVAKANHPLFRKRRLKWADLESFPWVLPPLDSLKREPLEAAFERHGIPTPKNRIETASVHMIQVYLEMTEAIAVLAGEVAAHYQSLGLLEILPLELPKMLRPIGMIWVKQRPLSSSTRLMMDCLSQSSALTVRKKRKGN